jgi:uncharacterized protein YndB with AHSA1/START domain
VLPYIFIGIAVLVVLFIVIVAMRPSDFRITRATTMSAPAAMVFAQVNDFHNWAAWSPWEKMDPALQKTFAGAPAGTGAGYSWVGNKKVGKGCMTILESRPNDLIRIKLEFLKPFQAVNLTEFTFRPAGDQTAVTWSMTGKNNFFFKAFGLLMSMDKMVGQDFEKGLAGMKSLVETVTRK